MGMARREEVKDKKRNERRRLKKGTEFKDKCKFHLLTSI